MDVLAYSQITKVIIMLLLVIAIFVILAFLLKKKLYLATGNTKVTILENIYLDNKNRLLNFHYKDKYYLLYISQSSCLLLDKQSGELEVDISTKKSSNFQQIISGLYKK